MGRKELFDKRFVSALVIVTVVDLLVILLVRKIVGNEAAGFVGASLATLLSVVLAKFETLRFRKIPDHKATWIDVPPINIWRVIVIAFAFEGAGYLLGFVSGLLPDIQWFGGWELPVLLIGGSLVVYFVGAFLVAKAFVRLRYSTVAFAVLLNVVFSVLMSVARPRPETIYALQYGWGPAIGAQGVLCLIFEIVAIVGVRLGLSREEDKTSE